MRDNHLYERITAFYHRLEEEKIRQDKACLKEELEEKIAGLEKETENFSQLAKDCRDTSELSSLVNDFKEGIRTIKELQEELDEKFSIFVIGNGNSGKSTLVNALLGEEVAEASAVPKTWKIDVFRTLDKNHAEIIKETESHREKQVLEVEKAKELLQQEDDRREASLAEAEEIIRAKRSQIDALAQQKNLTPTQKLNLERQYREKVYKEKLYHSPVTEARWPVADEGLLRHFQIVDTPGLMQDLNGVTLNESIKTYYQKADGILCVLDINKVADASVIKLIEQVEEELKREGMLCQNQHTLGILNRSDCISDLQQIKVLTDQAKELYKEHFSEILPLSAKLALEGRIEKNDLLIAGSGYQQLEDYINKYFLYESSSRKMDKRNKLLVLRQEALRKAAAGYKVRLAAEAAQRILQNEEFKQEMNELKVRYEQRISQLVTSYRQRVEEHIEEWVPRLFESDIKDEQEIEQSIFRTAQLNEEAAELARALKAELSGIEEKCRKQVQPGIKQSKLDAQEAELLQELEGKTEILLNSEEMKVSTLLEKGWLQFLNKYQIIKGLLKLTRSQACKKELSQHLEKLAQSLEQELDEVLNEEVEKKTEKLQKLREDAFTSRFGSSSKIQKQLSALDHIEGLLARPFPQKTIVDYIKGEKTE